MNSIPAAAPESCEKATLSRGLFALWPSTGTHSRCDRAKRNDYSVLKAKSAPMQDLMYRPPTAGYHAPTGFPSLCLTTTVDDLDGKLASGQFPPAAPVPVGCWMFTKNVVKSGV